jgi:hypothetical protein
MKWVSSHINIFGDEQADESAEQGRVRHCTPSVKWLREVWQQQQACLSALGLEQMSLGRELSSSFSSQRGVALKDCGRSSDGVFLLVSIRSPSTGESDDSHVGQQYPPVDANGDQES